MKTNFDNDKKFLHFLLIRGIMASDEILFNNTNSSTERYKQIMKGYRKKCFEYLEEEDPNQAIIDNL
jgi:hypothetical protein